MPLGDCQKQKINHIHKGKHFKLEPQNIPMAKIYKENRLMKNILSEEINHHEQKSIES